MENHPRREEQDTGAAGGRDLRLKLIRLFVENNRGKYEEIMNGIGAGEMDLARRLAHTLKSNAGQLGLGALQKAAEAVESQLKSGARQIAPGLAQTLKDELDAAMETLTPLAVRPAPDARAEPLDREDALALLQKTEGMLEEYDADCMTLIDSLGRIPGSEELVRLMEDFAFDKALEAAGELKARVLAGARGG